MRHFLAGTMTRAGTMHGTFILDVCPVMHLWHTESLALAVPHKLSLKLPQACNSGMCARSPTAWPQRYATAVRAWQLLSGFRSQRHRYIGS